MDHEALFSMVGLVSMAGWLVLLASPLIPEWSDRIAAWILPALLAAVYVGLLATSPSGEGDFSSLAGVGQLFEEPGSLLAGWVHFLAFDLVVGAWICRSARERGIRFWFVAPCLPFTFLLGPLGFLMYLAVVGGHRLAGRA